MLLEEMEGGRMVIDEDRGQRTEICCGCSK